ncbi:hypothetical protein DAPPUDRAFT_238257 [Daphnia pulex]|uniref:Uncharacterized protein n=1 Tax=Daphnia pulex TaxID=6669 RepID=E9G5Y3_DAPPU|nr:hypothetical protein DAPPUDRAFT_238257 [Daphnia pulex]|eukprot:EFX85090.1 hypothetical protein DAPPUDRAFT_238257 [Daphnia pulex]
MFLQQFTYFKIQIFKMPKRTAVDKLGKKGKTDTNEVKQKQSKPTADGILL